MKPSEAMFLILAAITSFLVTFLILPILIKYSLKKNLVVVPGRRKLHKKTTPSLGGVAIFLGFLIAALMWIDFNDWLTVRYLIASLLIIFFLGIRDDLVPFNAWRKMIGQAAAIVGLLFSEIKITSLYGLFGVYEIPLMVSFILTALFIIIVTNAYNLIDGLDGLAGTIGIIAMSAFGIWFHIATQPVYSLLCFSMAGGMLAFLIFNWEPAEIFMGDTGAMVGGMLLSILTIHFMNSNESLPDGHLVKFSSTVGAAACFIIVPICDTVRIIILRIARGQSPITPDKSHIHHGLIRLGLTHARASILLGALSITFILASYFFRSLGNGYVLLGAILTCTALSITLDRLLVKKLAGRDQVQS
jgi:UDP-N-acetylmuramyl pentapeptide phosphotransferase/UDP-N-acetylglucosamine-1-phosphate transferase